MKITARQLKTLIPLYLMTKLLWLIFSGLLVQTRSSSPKKPNIVMIVADDMGYQDVGFRGSDIQTPNLDKLAKSGVILENHYVMSVCAPTRASLMTGRHATRTGFWRSNLNPAEKFGLSLDETLLPEMLKRNGYSTYGVGKWHCGAHTWEHTPAKRGFDTFFGLFLGSQDYFTHRNERDDWLDLREDYLDGNGKLVDIIRSDLDGQYNTRLFSKKSVHMIKHHDKTKPMFLYLAYTAPHIPDAAPSKDIKMFATDSMTPARKKYAAMVSVMDEGIGEVVSALRDKGMTDNTILVFTSDNGARFSSEGSNFPLRGGKGSVLEGGVRGVAFVNSPLLQKTGYTNRNLHHVTDWYATFQELAGDKPERHEKVQLPVDGVNIWRSLSNDEPCRHEVLLNLRDVSKQAACSDTSCSESVDEETGSLRKCKELSGIKLKTGTPIKAQDFFAIRHKNWKLITGTAFELRGWSSENRREGYISFTDNHGSTHQRSLATGTLLFDLESDVREEQNVADKFPDVVETLMHRKKHYLKKVKFLEQRQIDDDIVMEDGIFRPWVEDFNNGTA